MRIGTTFSPHRAAARGLEWRSAFRRLIDLPLAPLRLSVPGLRVLSSGYDDLDWQLSLAEEGGKPVLLTVGMKAPGWPEFHLPDRLETYAPPGVDVAAANPALARTTLEVLQTTVERYRERRSVEAWQVENEPLNPSGPLRWWIGPEFLRREIAAARALDSRPLAVNVFAHFNRRLDAASRRPGANRPAPPPAAEALSLLGAGDVLGLDVYRRIGTRRLGVPVVAAAAGDWSADARRWRERALDAGVRTWIVEAQAEPWEPPGRAVVQPRTCRPRDLAVTVGELARAGFDTILLWGAEHWLAREAADDRSWLEAVLDLVGSARA
ncbi:MAG TPA: hypothetical protein VFD49_08475 [Candidatus Dormibacteraeota bacterium]|nr:hypothetical protein [Candidatus Dormibacteraeota bacterium]